MQESSLLDSFKLKPTLRTYLITDYAQSDNPDVLFSKAEFYTELNIRVINIYFNSKELMHHK